MHNVDYIHSLSIWGRHYKYFELIKIDNVQKCIKMNTNTAKEEVLPLLFIILQ